MRDRISRRCILAIRTFIVFSIWPVSSIFYSCNYPGLSGDGEDQPYWMLLGVKSHTTAPTITYVSDSYSFPANSVISEMSPTVTATPFTNCVSSPTLPDGLSLNAANCAISGTPTTVQDAADYTITASNSYGTGSTTVNITILTEGSSPSMGTMIAGKAPTVSYPITSYIFTRDSVISPVVPYTGGNRPTTCTASPTLPAGLSISAESCTISGSAITNQAPTNYTITAMNSYGTGSAKLSIAVVSSGLAPTLSYPASSYLLSKDSAITTIVPNIAGNAPTNCTVSPALPAGLSINSLSCAISGTPTVEQSSTNYTITALNGYGSTTATISIGVKVTGTPPTLNFSSYSYSYSQDANVRLKPVLGGSTPTGCSTSPALPPGLSINATSCAVSGSPTTPQSATTYTITATNDFGNGVTSLSIEILPGLPPTVTYSTALYTFSKNGAIPNLTPASLSGGAPTSCVVSPTLPDGLFIDASTCTISGTPAAEQLPTSYTITPSNIYGTGSAATVKIQILDPVNAALTNLNVDIHPPALTDKNGVTLPTDYNPLMKPVSTFGKIDEIVGYGPATASTAILDGVYENMNSVNQGYTPQSLGTYGHTSHLINTIKGGTAGDFDGDGYDETSLIYIDSSTGAIHVSVRDGKNGGYGLLYTGDVDSTLYYSTTGSTPGMIDVTAGDIDGDGKDEIIIATGIRSFESVGVYDYSNQNNWTGSGTGNVRLIILDDAANSFAKLIAYNMVSDNSARSVYVDADDVTGDGIAEIAASYTKVNAGISQALYVIYEYSAGTLEVKDSGGVEVTENETVYKPMLADVTSGDLNRDGIPEFIFAGVEWPTNANPNTHYDLMSVQFNGSDYVTLSASAKRITDDLSGDWSIGANTNSYSCNDTSSCDYILVLDVFAETLDVDGDENVELLVNNRVFDRFFNMKQDVNGKDMWIWGLMNNKNTDAGSNNPFREFNRSNTWITVGDFNGDHRENIAFWGRNFHGNIPVWGINESGVFDQVGWYITDKLYDGGGVGQSDVKGNYPVLFAANTDDDSMVLSFDHAEVRFTEPIPLHVLAAAPCYVDPSQNLSAPNQNLASCSSNFGSSSSTSTENTDTWSFGVALRAGGKFGKEDKFAVQVQMEAEYHHDWVSGSESSTTIGSSYTSGTNEDSIVFSSIPYDIYIYKILSVPPDNTDPEISVGAYYPIWVARKPAIQMAELSYYNKMVASINPDRVIGTEVFRHTPGNPWSYPSISDKAAIQADNGCITADCRLESDLMAVGEGTGFNEVFITYEEAIISGFANGGSLSISVDAEIGNATGAFVGGFTFSGGYQHDTTTTTSNECSYSGTVGALDANSYATDRYRYGMFVYKQANHPSGFDFDVLNYWVEEP